MSYIPGVDLSSVQGNVDFEKVAAAGYRFAILKCGDGNDGIDPFFVKNLAGCRANGITPGAYQFLFPIGLASDAAHSNRAPEEQAKYHFAASRGLGCSAGEIRTFMDCEWPSKPEDWVTYACNRNQIRDWLLRYKTQYDSESGASTGIYTDKYWWLDQIGGDQFEGLLSAAFWSADPQATSALPADGTSPFLYAPFTSWSIWQHTDRLVVPGIVDLVDGDCIPDEATFTALTTRP
jgi:GH25 family lysozyme M1 (1,4-beta-N-acetylmuramidase)